MEHKQHQTIKEQLAEHIARYTAFKQISQMNNSFVNPLAELAIINEEAIEQAVYKLRAAWKLGYQSLPDLTELFSRHGIQLIELDAPFDFQGLSGWTTERRPVIVINQHHSVDHKILLSLKELGHLLLNFRTDFTKQQINKLCRRFAKAMLLPRPTMIMALGQKRRQITQRELAVLSQKHGPTTRCIMDRARDLQIISEQLHQQFISWLHHTTHTLSNQEMQTDCFKQLIYRAAVEEIIPMSRVNNLSVRRLREIKRPFLANEF